MRLCAKRERERERWKKAYNRSVSLVKDMSRHAEESFE
jgi:hypothetical protein